MSICRGAAPHASFVPEPRTSTQSFSRDAHSSTAPVASPDAGSTITPGTTPSMASAGVPRRTASIPSSETAVSVSNVLGIPDGLMCGLADGLVDDFYEVHDAHRPARGLEAGGDLKETPGVARHDYFGIRSEDVLHFAIAQLRGGLGFEEIVDPGGTAADFGFGNLMHADTWNRLQEPARLHAHALGMLQMTGVVISGLERHGASRRARLELYQHFRNVLALRGERLRLCGVHGVVAQQMTVAFHCRAAPCSIDDDGIGIRRFERVDELPRRRHRVLFFARIDRKSVV